MSEPEYHKQPTTFDPTKPDIPDDAPLAQGHDRELAEKVAEADHEHTEAVQAEAEQPEVGPRDPGDHAGQDNPDSSDDSSDVPQGSVDEVLAWVGDDRDRASRALEAERSGQQRTTLIAKLEAIAE